MVAPLREALDDNKVTDVALPATDVWEGVVLVLGIAVTVQLPLWAAWTAKVPAFVTA